MKDQNAAKTYLNRGNAKVKLGEYAAAVRDYDQAIHLNPDDTSAYYNRGVLKVYLGEYLPAITDFDKAIHLKTDYARAYYNRGNVKADLNRRLEANQDFRTALRLAIQAGDMNTKAGVEEKFQKLDDTLDGTDDIPW